MVISLSPMDTVIQELSSIQPMENKSCRGDDRPSKWVTIKLFVSPFRVLVAISVLCNVFHATRIHSGSTPVPSFHFNVPHDLTLMEDKNALCVSDRENDRLQCFHAANCTFINEIKLREVGSRVFAATYTPAAGESRIRLSVLL